MLKRLLETRILEKLMKIKHSLLQTAHHEIFIVLLQIGSSLWRGIRHFVADFAA